MDVFAFIVLEETLEMLTQQQVPHDGHSRLEQCVAVIRACMDLIALNPANPDYLHKMRQALTELADIERQNGEPILANRLKMIVHQLSSAGALERRFVHTAS